MCQFQSSTYRRIFTQPGVVQVSGFLALTGKQLSVALGIHKPRQMLRPLTDSQLPLGLQYLAVSPMITFLCHPKSPFPRVQHYPPTTQTWAPSMLWPPQIDTPPHLTLPVLLQGRKYPTSQPKFCPPSVLWTSLLLCCLNLLIIVLSFPLLDLASGQSCQSFPIS